MTPDRDAAPDAGDDRPRSPVRVGILDDHAVIVDGIAFWIGENAPDVQVALRATRWLDLIRDPEFPVDIVLMDLQLADSVSIESRIRACRAAGCEVVVVTALDDAESRERSLAAGAVAFVPKTLPVSEVIDVVRRVARGERVPKRRSAAQVAAAAAASAAADESDIDDAHLSAAERRAVSLYVQGLSTSEVARRMDVGYETAKTYLRRARDKYAKVGRPAGRRSELIRRAAEDGMLE
ncbi:response regulator [Agromyces sp. C10]|uniref:response regulator transcription factor n=1 Tax=Agromyces sp. C10 TaxID=2935077 RepID=UPI00200AF88B|nr:response regulator transcription factor [Agromyces sp. C10]MCK8608277.1 response regulator transcription factor [Agromyces sp. C10]